MPSPRAAETRGGRRREGKKWRAYCWEEKEIGDGDRDDEDDERKRKESNRRDQEERERGRPATRDEAFRRWGLERGEILLLYCCSFQERGVFWYGLWVVGCGLWVLGSGLRGWERVKMAIRAMYTPDTL